MRERNTDRQGLPFTGDIKRAVWQKATIVPGGDPAVVRQGRCGALIYRDNYGERVDGGWEIDHIKPLTLGGNNDLSNLQPLHWENNRAKGDEYPNFNCKIGRH